MTSPADPPTTALQARLADGSLGGIWTLDPARSTAAFRSATFWGLAKVRGTFGGLEGAATVSPTGEATGQLTISTESLSTRNAKRDTHLRSADFFHTERYPAIIFSLSKITPAGDGVEVAGTVTVRERSQPISFPARLTLTDDGAVELDATVQLDRSEFGLTWNQLGMTSMKNEVTLHTVFTKA